MTRRARPKYGTTAYWRERALELRDESGAAERAKELRQLQDWPADLRFADVVPQRASAVSRPPETPQTISSAREVSLDDHLAAGLGAILARRPL
jgi:hypothetical protein